MHRGLRYLDQIFGKDAAVLSEWIEEIKGDIYARQYLARDVLVDLESRASLMERELEKASHWSPGYKPSADRRRSDLESQLGHLRLEQREQKLSLWRDIGTLRKEFRLLVREYKRAKRRRDLMRPNESE